MRDIGNVREDPLPDVPIERKRLVGESRREEIRTAIIRQVTEVHAHRGEGAAVVVHRDAGMKTNLGEAAGTLVVERKLGTVSFATKTSVQPSPS